MFSIITIASSTTNPVEMVSAIHVGDRGADCLYPMTLAPGWRCTFKMIAGVVSA
jgi:hypothetical protein